MSEAGSTAALKIFAIGVALCCPFLAVASASAVVGGKRIAVAAAPWAVLVRDAFPRDAHTCTGSIIDSTHILTAAHCLFDARGVFTRTNEVSIVAGVSNYRHPDQGDSEQVRMVASIRVDPRYVWWTEGTTPQADVTHDVAVLTLAAPLDTKGPDTGLIDLSRSAGPVRAGVTVRLAGFGVKNASGTDDGALAQIQLRTLSAKLAGRCPRGAVCTTSGTQALCAGDSGAGLVTMTAHPVLIGVAGLASPLCRGGGYAIYSYLGAPSVRRFIFGHTPSGAPPEPAPTRWRPSGWRSYSTRVNSSALAVSLPKSWSLRSNPQSELTFSSEEMHSDMTVTALPSIGSRKTLFSLARTNIPKTLEKLDPQVRMQFRSVNIPGATSVLQATAEFTQNVGSSSYMLWVRHYILFQNGTGWDVEYEVSQSAKNTAIPVFRKSAQTIHFSTKR
jgi:Trypsin